jgi:hypothetical protein
MKKRKLFSGSTRTTDLSFDELDEDLTDDWRIKADRLQARRWRQLKRQMI